MNKRFVVGSADRTRLRARVLEILKPGRQMAITGDEIARTLREPDDRRVRVVIGELIKEGVPIASAVSRPFGYYIAGSGEEAADYIRVLENRIREDNARLEAFREAVKEMGVPEQPSLMGQI